MKFIKILEFFGRGDSTSSSFGLVSGRLLRRSSFSKMRKLPAWEGRY
jgi:hypothetical protein